MAKEKNCNNAGDTVNRPTTAHNHEETKGSKIMQQRSCISHYSLQIMFFIFKKEWLKK